MFYLLYCYNEVYFFQLICHNLTSVLLFITPLTFFTLIIIRLLSNNYTALMFGRMKNILNLIILFIYRYVITIYIRKEIPDLRCQTSAVFLAAPVIIVPAEMGTQLYLDFPLIQNRRPYG